MATMTTQSRRSTMEAECVKCDRPDVTTRCSCSNLYCDACYKKHLQSKPTHRGLKYTPGSSLLSKAWKFVKGSLAYTPEDYVKDESAKWFGLTEEFHPHSVVCRIVETTRFAELVEASKHAYPDSPKRQFPSLVSFVGDTGAGKSSLIRALLQVSHNQRPDLERPEGPIVGNESGFVSTTGEVNLYNDPQTFGTDEPLFYIDCEGLGGTRPIASQHQKSWSDGARSYMVASRDGRMTDRVWAVQKLYPKFTYIFSDVICYVTRSQRSWATIVDHLLGWVNTAAQEAINQYALPAVILVLNGPPTGQHSWVYGDPDEMTAAFFASVEPGLRDSVVCKKLAKQYGVGSIEAIFRRCFSSVHVHFIPLKGYRVPSTDENLGSDEIMFHQYEKLLARVRTDASRVQDARDERGMRHDSRQLALTFHYAFKHLTSNTDRPFDFGSCRAKSHLPSSTQGHVTGFLRACLGDAKVTDFNYPVSVLASCIIMKALRDNDYDVLSAITVYDPSTKKTYETAVSDYLRFDIRCTYVDNNGFRCVNTQRGHSKGHQNENGTLLGQGPFQSGEVGAAFFLSRLQTRITELLQRLDQCDGHQKRRAAQQMHRSLLQANTVFTRSKSATRSGRKTCLGCLLTQPSYELPCGHFLCTTCINIFDEADRRTLSPSVLELRECFLCADKDARRWPVQLGFQPYLAGIRVLSLDGGGVRGIIQLEILKRMLAATKLSTLNTSAFFDLIVGTSAGGMVALGLGEHKWSVEECAKKYEELAHTGLVPKTGTKVWGFGWVARWFRHSIYHSKHLQSALTTAYGETRQLFGLVLGESCPATRNVPRVAVTTTVDRDLKLFTNYRLGAQGRMQEDNKATASGEATVNGTYLSSTSLTWEVARSTSAAPLYFEPFANGSAGVVCRDGGLKHNNPVKLAFRETKAIWGEDVKFDYLISLGTGSAIIPPEKPSNSIILPEWLSVLFKNFMTTFNGQVAWDDYYKMIPNPLTYRSKRMNLTFQSAREPALDDVEQIDSMKREAAEYNFKPNAHFRTLVEPRPKDLILDAATQLRASLFFFHPTGLAFDKHHTVGVITGRICCRISPYHNAFRELYSQIKCFRIGQRSWYMPQLEQCKPWLGIEVDFNHDLRTRDIQIRVQFDDHYSSPVSGFPLAFEDFNDDMNRWKLVDRRSSR